MLVWTAAPVAVVFVSVARMAFGRMAFGFLDPGPLIDGELELVAPHRRWIDDWVSGSESGPCRAARQQAEDFLRLAPGGRQNALPGSARVPAYHFWMRLHPARGPILPRWAQGRPAAVPRPQIAGSIALRIGNTPDIELYLGHVGYNVHPFARGNHYAERACRLLRQLALAHGLSPLWITCNPDNHPSRRTCERLGATLVELLPLPPNHALRERGDREKLRFRWDIRL
jgi:tagatose 1,6-diphosphate aldolase